MSMYGYGGYWNYVVKMVNINTTSPVTGGGGFAGPDYTIGFLPKEIAGRAYITTGNPQGWAGSDVGAWINDAWAFLLATYPSNGGEIYVGPGLYSFTTHIVIGTQFASVALIGAGAFGPPSGAASQYGGTVLNYTPTSGAAITVGGTNNNGGGVRLENFALQGAGIGTGATAIIIGATAVGSQAGGTHTGVSINGFTNGWVWGTVGTTGKIAYGQTFINCKTQYCTNGLTPNGEANNYISGLIGNCVTGVLGNVNGTDFNAIGTAFDDNTTTAINVSQPLFRMTLDAARFENAGGGTELYITQSDGSITVLGGTMQTDAVSSTGNFFVNATGGVFNLYGTWLYSAGRVMAQAFAVSSGVKLFQANPIISPSAPAGTFPALFTAGGAFGVFPRVLDKVPAFVNLNTIPSGTATNVDGRGGLPLGANVQPLPVKIRCTVLVTNAATAQTCTATLHFGTANGPGDATVATLALAAGTAAVGSGKFVFEFDLLSSTTAIGHISYANGNGTAVTGLSATLATGGGPATGLPVAVAITSPTFVGCYLQTTAAATVSVRSVEWEILT